MDKIFNLLGIKTGRNELNFSGSLNNTGSGTQFNLSSKLRAILHHLEKISTTNSSIKKLNEFVVEDREYEEEGMKRKAEHLLPEKIEVEKGVFCEVSYATSNGDANKKEKEVQLKIYSNVVKIPELVDLVRQWEKAYEEQSRNELKFSGSLN